MRHSLSTFGRIAVLVLVAAITSTGVLAQSSTEEAALVNGNTAFAFDLYRQLAGEEGSLFFSPYSISQALAMTYAGARGETARQMAAVLHFDLEPAALHPSFGALAQSLTDRPSAAGSGDQPFRLNIANSLWGDQQTIFLPEFLALLQSDYGAGLQAVDFRGQPEAARQQINDWIAEQTEDKIRDLVPEGAINPLTRLVLANAIYFNANWLRPFYEGATSDAPFTLLDGTVVNVPMMNQQERFLYGRGENYQAITLPYVGQGIEMVLILPDEGMFEAVEQGLTPEWFNGVLAGLKSQEVLLAMPKFSFEYTLELSEALMALGMPDAFSDLADFSGMTAEEALYISKVLHKAFIELDEAGTEAAAATVVIMEAMMAPMPQEPVELRLDRPFLFAIRDSVTGSLLFLGRVLDPLS